MIITNFFNFYKYIRGENHKKYEKIFKEKRAVHFSEARFYNFY